MAHSAFKDVIHDPPIEIFELTRIYNEDKYPKKVNLGIGAYKDENCKPWVLPVVRAVEQQLAFDMTLDHEYLPFLGLNDFTNAAVKLLLGPESEAVKDNLAFGAQSVSGTGALVIGMEFLKRNGYSVIYLSNPTWKNHTDLARQAGFEVREYRYYDPITKTIDFDGLVEDLSHAPSRSIVFLHCCAHNPSGLDPSPEQWAKLSQLMKVRSLLPFFDVAYQGCSSGSLDQDAKAVRLFVKDGHELFAAQSFSKNMGLYSELVGNLTVVVNDPDVVPKIKSQMVTIVRGYYSNPPGHGARVAATILNNKALFDQWKENLKTMANRTNSMRQLLYHKLTILGTPGNWDHVLKSIGLYTITGLNERQCNHLIREYHIYLSKDGRINVAALSPNNIDYIANAIYDVVCNVKDDGNGKP